MMSRFFYFNSLDKFISYIRGVWLDVIIVWFIEIPEINANSVDPDQTPRSAASALGLHHLPMSLLLDAKLKRVKANRRFPVTFPRRLIC